MRAAQCLAAGARPGPWTISAFALSVLGIALATWLIIGSDGDPSHVLWPLVVLPIAVCAAPVLVPRRGVSIGAAVILAAWCVVATLSIGFLLWPALAVLIAAVLREGA